MKHILLLSLALVLASTPAASVKCSRDLVPGTSFEVTGYGASLTSGGGKTVLSADMPSIPGVTFRAK